MRVTGGRFRGQRIRTSKTRVYRPTQDKVRAAIFNHLAGFVNGARVLDLYCGTGALGIGALSRGAEYAVFCDNTAPAVRMTSENLKNIVQDANRYEVIRSDAASLCSRLAGRSDKFDLVFVDPPYNSGLYEGIIMVLGSTGIIVKNGVLVVEHSKKYALPRTAGRLGIYAEKTYGDTMISYYTMED